MRKICCFGELLLRLPPTSAGNWLQHNQLQVFVGGAELNVATALANWQQPVKYFTALPDNIISRDIIDYLQLRDIDTSNIHFGGERIGLYYLKEGADMKSEENVFDRKYSSFSTLSTGVVDWDLVLQDVSWFHFSAIAPAVSASAAALVHEALEAATRKNITISVDLNYRSLLWKYGKSPLDVMPALAKYCHVIMGNLWAANTLLGTPINNAILAQASDEEYCRHATETSGNIFSAFLNCRWVANTFRFSNNDAHIRYYATLDTVKEQSVSPLFETNTIAEKVGSGDCFMAGLIYGINNLPTPANIIAFAAAAAFGKLQEKGDATRQSVNDINHLLQKTLDNQSIV